jgi:hypothetical protein
MTDAREDPHKLADELARAADKVERESAELKDNIDEARQDWQRKRADGGVPGAPPPEGGDAEAGDAAGEI